MDNPIYVALSRQMILRRQMDVVANNIANADTPAFKVENLIVSSDPQGRLVTQKGLTVQGDGGEIVVDTTKGQISVARDGSISQGTNRLGKIAVVSFADKAGLTKEGDGLYSNRSNVAAAPAPDVVVHQAMIESSNVQPILQITDMIEVSRAYERMVKIIDQTSELDRKAIERLGRIA